MTPSVRERRSVLLAAAVALALLPTSLQAQKKVAKAKPKPAAAAPAGPAWVPSAPFATPAAQLLALKLPRSPVEEDAEIPFQAVKVIIADNGTRVRQLHQIVRVRSQQGVDDWGEVSMAFDPWYENRPAIKARVITADGREHWLDGKTLSEEPTNGGENYSTRRRVRAPLPGLAVGAVFEVLYESTEHRPFFKPGGRDREWLYAPTYTQTLRVTFDVGARAPFAYQVRGATLAPKVTTGSGAARKQLTFELHDELPYAEWPDPAPSELSPAPAVEYGYARSWQEVAAAYAREVDQQLNGFDAAAIVKAAAGTAVSARDKAAKLLAYVHANVRYVALELGERSIVPAPPGQVMQQRFGDCKDKATLLVALLRAAGLPASVALLETGPGLDVSPALPGFGSFDHAIVYVTGKDGFWIDPASNYTEVGVLPAQDQDRNALIASAGTTKLVRTPASKRELNTFTELTEFTYPAIGRATVRETTSASGPNAVALRAQFDASAEQLKQNLSDYAQKMYGADVTRVETVMTGPEAKLVIETGGSKKFETGDDAVVLGLGPSGLLNRIPHALIKPRQSEHEAKQEEKLDPRTKKAPQLPLWLAPETRSAVYQLKAPPGYAWEQLPDDLDVQAGPLRLQRRSTQNGDVARVEYSVATGGVVPAANVERVHQGVLGFLDTADFTARALYAASRAKEQGDYAAAAKLHRETIAGGRGGANALRRFALDLLGMGLMLPARRVAREAVAADDKLSWTHFLLGALAYRDDVGRALRPGADVAAARKSYAKAAALEPDESRMQDQYGRSLLTAPNRLVFGAGADLTKAREVLQALRTKENTEEYDAIILNTLVYQRKPKEAIAFVQSLKNTTQQMRGAWVASIALVDGVAAAQRKATQLAGSEEEQLLIAALGHLLILGEYKLSEQVQLLPVLEKRLTAREREEAHALADQAGCTAKLHPAVKAILALETPVLLGEQTPEHVLDQVAKDAGKGYVGAYLLRWYLRDLFPTDGAKSLGIRYELARRTCVQTWRVEEKNDVVRVQRFVPGGERASGTYLLRKRGGAYRLRAVLSGGYYQLAELMREDLAAHQLDAAEQWATWLHEEIKDDGGKRDAFVLADGANDAWLSPLRPANRESALWLMAGMYLANYDRTPALLEQLRAARKRLGGDPRLALAADAAIAYWLRWNRPKESVPLLEGLHRGNALDVNLWHDYVTALARSHEYDKALAELRQLFERYPDRDRSRLLYAETAEGNWQAAEQQVIARQKEGKTSSGELNAVAWGALFEPGKLDGAVRYAEEGVRMSGRHDYAVMHTLAVLYAEQGRYNLALSTIDEALSLGREYPVNSSTWYVYGRVAEALGFNEDARTYYQRCKGEPPMVVDPIAEDAGREHSTWTLAQKRLAGLPGSPRK